MGVAPTEAPPGGAGVPSDPEREAARQALSQRLAVGLVVPLALLLAAVVLVFFVLFGTSTIVGPSMYPTLHDHDFVLLTKGLPTPKRGDVVILNVLEKGRRVEWVKRVVAIGGDTVDVSGDIVTVNGAPESFPHAIINSGETTPVEHVVVATGQLFVMGDNRGISEDSRYVGTFPASSVRGKVVAIYAPIGRVGLVPGP
jgi:signal peptidase I